MPCPSPNGSNASTPDTPYQNYLCLRLCRLSTLTSSMMTTFAVASVVLLLPVYIFILHLGVKQWRQQSFMSHFDFFTYHMVLFELLSVPASVCLCLAIHTENNNLMLTGMVFVMVNSPGQLLLHTLTCAERYLAIVHPVSYLSLKGERWIALRSVAIVFVWPFCILMTVMLFVPGSHVYLMLFIPVVFVLALVLVFCLSALVVLCRSGPGKGSRGRKGIDQSKLKAFYLIVSVLVVLLIRLIWIIISALWSLELNQHTNCLVLAFTFWIGLPSSVLAPLLYLQRKRLLCCIKKK